LLGVEDLHLTSELAGDESVVRVEEQRSEHRMRRRGFMVRFAP